MQEIGIGLIDLICCSSPGLVYWPSAFQAVDGTELVIECVMASYEDAPPSKAYLMLNDKSIPTKSLDYEVNRAQHNFVFRFYLDLLLFTYSTISTFKTECIILTFVLLDGVSLSTWLTRIPINTHAKCYTQFLVTLISLISTAQSGHSIGSRLRKDDGNADLPQSFSCFRRKLCVRWKL